MLFDTEKLQPIMNNSGTVDKQCAEPALNTISNRDHTTLLETTQSTFLIYLYYANSTGNISFIPL